MARSFEKFYRFQLNEVMLKGAKALNEAAMQVAHQSELAGNPTEVGSPALSEQQAWKPLVGTM